MPFIISAPITTPPNPTAQNPSVASRAPDNHFYRPRGNPFQKLPKAVHSHSHSHSLSASSIFSASSYTSMSTSSHNHHHHHARSNSGLEPHDIVARILAQDEIPRGTFIASEKEKGKAKQQPQQSQRPPHVPLQVHVHIQQQQQTSSSTTTVPVVDSTGIIPSSSSEEDRQRKAYPERIDSRRALLSVINGIKAPIVFKGSAAPIATGTTSLPPPVPALPAKKAVTQQQQQQQQQPKATASTAHQRVDAVSYLHKQLPPTPPSSHSSQPSPQPTSAAEKRQRQTQSNALPPIRPLNLDLKPNNPLNANRLGLNRQHGSNVQKETLAKRRFSRFIMTNSASGNGNGGVSRSATGRFRAVPPPIKPPRFTGPSAFNGPSSANTSEEDLPQQSHLDMDDDDESDVDPFETYHHRHHHKRRNSSAKNSHRSTGSKTDPMQLLAKKVSTPIGELPITPLDIPVDWDDLRDRWTSPVLMLHHPNGDESAAAAPLNLDQLLQESLEGIMDAYIDEEGEAASDEAGDELDLEDAFHDKVVVLKSLPIDEGREGGEEEESDEEKEELERVAFATFQDDVAELFKHSPTRTATDDWRTEEGSGSSSVRRLTVLTTAAAASVVNVAATREPELVVSSPISSCSASYNSGPGSANEVEMQKKKAALVSSSTTSLNSGSNSDHGCSTGGSGGLAEREKRHGRVLVKKELKLCINIDTDYLNDDDSSAGVDDEPIATLDRNSGSRERKNKKQKRVKEDPKAGESFLMMSPESASTRASTIAW